MYEIEKNKEIPSPNMGRGAKYPFRKMEPGDSFFVECDMSDKKAANRLRSSILGSSRVGRFKGQKFSTRSTKNGIRVWRVL